MKKISIAALVFSLTTASAGEFIDVMRESIALYEELSKTLGTFERGDNPGSRNEVTHAHETIEDIKRSFENALSTCADYQPYANGCREYLKKLTGRSEQLERIVTERQARFNNNVDIVRRLIRQGAYHHAGDAYNDAKALLPWVEEKEVIAELLQLCSDINDGIEQAESGVELGLEYEPGYDTDASDYDNLYGETDDQPDNYYQMMLNPGDSDYESDC